MTFGKYLRILAALCASASTAVATGVIVPLYIFPGSAPSCTAWAPLISAISANPSVPFYLIVNPASGPGSADSQPDPGYQGCIPKLKASNVEIVGYVPTGSGTRAQSAVTQDIDTYAGWTSTFRPSGIFFDEVEPTKSFLSTYTIYSQQARQAFNGGAGFVILNPGSAPATTYFAIADQIVTLEDFYSDFSPSDLTISASSPAEKQGIILHDSPSTLPTSLISQLVATDGIGSLYITDDTQANGGNPYDSLPTDFASFVSAVSADS